ncbi:MAG: glycosyltransferase family 1 protein, partial [Actinobacteria bacterium]|nr:glycosyltransferase family 1 protein [Actinomycetota bacterium]
MRVLHVHTTYRQGGGEDVVVETERKMLEDAGVDVAPVDARNPSGDVAAVAALATASWNHHAARRVLALARRERADVVHIHNTWFALTAAVPAVLSGAGYPVVATL